MQMSKFLINYILNVNKKKHFYSYPAALALVANGKVDVKKLITHHFDITDTAEAFNTSRHGLGGAIKVMIHCQPIDANNKK